MEGILIWIGEVWAQTVPGSGSVDWLDRLTGPWGLLIGLIITVLGNLRGWWYSGAAYRKLEVDMREAIKELKVDRDEWKSIALRSMNVSDTAVRRIVEPNVERT